MLSHPTTCGSFQPYIYRAQRGSAIRASPRVIIPRAKAVPECSHSGTVTRGGVLTPTCTALLPSVQDRGWGFACRQYPATSLAAKQHSRRLCPAFPQQALGRGRVFVKRWGDRPCQPWGLAWCPPLPNDPHRSSTWFPWQSRRKEPRPLCSSEQP